MDSANYGARVHKGHHYLRTCSCIEFQFSASSRQVHCEDSNVPIANCPVTSQSEIGGRDRQRRTSSTINGGSGGAQDQPIAKVQSIRRKLVELSNARSGEADCALRKQRL